MVRLIFTVESGDPPEAGKKGELIFQYSSTDATNAGGQKG